MRRLVAIAFLIGLFILSLLGCGSGGGDDNPSTPPTRRPQGTPQLLAFTSSDDFDIRKILNLAAKLVIVHSEDENGSPVKEIEQEVKFVPKDPNNPRSPLVIQIIPDDGLHVDGLSVGDFDFRIDLFHRSSTQGDIKLAMIEQAIGIQAGQDVKVTFEGAAWRYDFDDDQDGYANITELMHGHFEKKQDAVGGSTKVWISTPTDTKDSASHPSQVSIIEGSRIGSTSPDNDGHAKIIGDPLSVQSGVQVTIVHMAADGTVKETVNTFSRLDGSFECSLNNSVQGDRVQVYTTSLPTLTADPTYSSLSVSDPSFASVSLEIHFLPVKVKACFSINGRNAFPETGFVVVQAEGLGANDVDSEVIFPTEGSGGASAQELYISSQTAKVTELTVKIPDGAISGFPIVHNRTPNHESYGRCDKKNDVVVLQNRTAFGTTNSTKPDLFSDLLDAPFVALVGQPISIDFHLLNQGVGDTFSAFQYRTYLSPDRNLSISDTDREVFANSQEMDILSDPSRAFETITGQIRYGDVPLSIPLGFVLKKMDYVFNSVTFPFLGKNVYFKALVDPASNPFSPGSVPEGNEQNNFIVASHNTFIHSVNLLLEGSNGMPVNSGGSQVGWELLDNAGGSLGALANLTLTMNNSVATSTTTLSGLVLRHGAIHFQLGRVKNQGTYPLHRTCDSAGNCTYTNSNNDDPLNTNGNEYKNKSLLASQIDQVNGEIDLAEPEAVGQTTEADDLNTAEYPVVVRAYFSANNTPQYDSFSGKFLGQAILDCNGCEFCKSRLEGESIETVGNDKNQSFYEPKDGSGNPKYTDATNIDFDMRLDTGSIPVGPGNLYLIAEPLVTNLEEVKQIGTKNFTYCGKNEDERKALNLPIESDNGPKSLKDYDLQDNVVRLPIISVAPDLEFLGGLNAPTSAVLGRSFNNVLYQIRNEGAAGADATNVHFYVKDSVGVIFDLEQSGTSPALSPFANSPLQMVNFNFPTDNAAHNLPFGPNLKLVVKVDDPEAVYEVSNDPAKGENNNFVEFSPFSITAPDLTIFGLGTSTCDSGGNCISTDLSNGLVNSSIGDTFTMDVYAKNVGTASATTNYTVAVIGGQVTPIGTCNLTGSGTGVTVGVNQLVRVPVAVSIPNSSACRTPTGSIAPMNLTAIIASNGDNYERALGDNGRVVALSNNVLSSSSGTTYQVVNPGVLLPNGAFTDTSLFNPTSPTQVPRVFVGQADLGIDAGSLTIHHVGTATTPTEWAMGLTYDVSFTVTNHGDGAANAAGGVKVKAFLIEQGGGGGTYELNPIGGQSIGSFAVGATSVPVSNVQFTIPSGLPEPGNYKLRVHVNADNNPQEPSPDNNSNIITSVASFQIKHLDLMANIDSVTFPSSCGGSCGFGVAGENVTVNFTISDNGNASEGSVPATTARVYAKVAGTAQGALDVPVLGFAVGGNQSISGSVTLPAGDFGNFDAVVSADFGDVIPENNEANNSKSDGPYEFHVRPVASAGGDFSVTRIDHDSNPSTPPQINISLSGGCSNPETGSGSPTIALSGAWSRNGGTSNCSLSATNPSAQTNSPVNFTATCSAETNLSSISFKLTCSSSAGLNGEDTITVNVN